LQGNQKLQPVRHYFFRLSKQKLINEFSKLLGTDECNSSWTLKMIAIRSFETSGTTYLATERHVAQDLSNQNEWILLPSCYFIDRILCINETWRIGNVVFVFVDFCELIKVYSGITQI
jgi:hypothetical protein